MSSLGRAAYTGYADRTAGKTYDGRDMPTWEGLTDRIREAWEAAGAAAVAYWEEASPVDPNAPHGRCPTCGEPFTLSAWRRDYLDVWDCAKHGGGARRETCVTCGATLVVTVKLEAGGTSVPLLVCPEADAAGVHRG
jgi:hypothetical protein